MLTSRLACANLNSRKVIHDTKMNAYLLDYNSLGELADAIIAQKFPQATRPGAALAPAVASLREYIIKSLDDQIFTNILERLPVEQKQALAQLAEKEVTDPAQYQAVFEAAHLDFDQIINTTVDQFRADLDQLLKENHHE